MQIIIIMICLICFFVLSPVTLFYPEQLIDRLGLLVTRFREGV